MQHKIMFRRSLEWGRFILTAGLTAVTASTLVGAQTTIATSLPEGANRFYIGRSPREPRTGGGLDGHGGLMARREYR